MQTVRLHDPTVEDLAKAVIARSPNPDWKDRGGLVLLGQRIMPIVGYDASGGDREFGQAITAAFEFERPLVEGPGTRWERTSPFVGFVLAAAQVDTDTWAINADPIIGEFRPEAGPDAAYGQRGRIGDYDKAARGLARAFCPSCGAALTLKSSQRVVGPEAVVVTTRCTKCGWHDEDIVD